MHRLMMSFRYALSGIIHAFKTQRNMKIHTVALVMVIFAGFFLNVSGIEWGLLLAVSALVVVAEMMNTALEALVDIETEHFHPLAKTAKDVAAGAVLLASLFAVLVGVIILLPKTIGN